VGEPRITFDRAAFGQLVDGGIEPPPPRPLLRVSTTPRGTVIVTSGRFSQRWL